MYCTVGRRHELEAGMAGRDRALYGRMIDELGRTAAFGEEHGSLGLFAERVMPNFG